MKTWRIGTMNMAIRVLLIGGIVELASGALCDIGCKNAYKWMPFWGGNGDSGVEFDDPSCITAADCASSVANLPCKPFSDYFYIGTRVRSVICGRECDFCFGTAWRTANCLDPLTWYDIEWYRCRGVDPT